MGPELLIYYISSDMHCIDPTFPQAYKNPTCTLSFLPLTSSPNINLSSLFIFPTIFSSHCSSFIHSSHLMATLNLLLVLSFLLLASSATACGSCEPKPKPNPTPKAPPVNPFCPRDALKLGVCADVLGLVNAVIGSPPSGEKCCALLEGLADLEVAACLCTALKANVLGINLNVPIALSALVSACQKTVPDGFKCV